MKKIETSQSFLEEKRTYKIIFGFLIFGFVLGYSSIFQPIGSVFKYGTMLLMITYFFRYNVDFKKYIPIISLLMPFFIVPLILVVIGVYQLNLKGILFNAFFYLMYILVSISIIETFNNIIEFVQFVNIGIFVPFFLNIILSGQVSFNIFLLLTNMVDNSRNARSFLGFTNPNTAGLIAMVGLVSCAIVIINKVKVPGTLFCFLFYFVAIVNTGSRTALMSPIFGFLITGLIYSVGKLSVNKKITAICFAVGCMLVLLFFVYNKVNISLSWDSLNELTSERLFRQIFTFRYLKNNHLLTFGIGSLNSSALYGNDNSFVNTLNTDNSPMYFLLTIGIVGILEIFTIIGLIISKIKQENFEGIFCLATWLISSLFEHTLFVPSSLFSLFFLSAIYVSFKNTDYLN